MRILHTADSHLMLAQYGSPARGREFMEALINVVSVAEANDVKVILHGGDLLDTRDLHGDVFDQLLEVDAALRKAGITMWCVTGNHDLTEPPFTATLDKRARDAGGEAGIRCLDNRRITLANGKTVLGLPFMAPEDLKLRLDAEEPADILVWHGSVREFMGFPSPSAVCLDDFPPGKFPLVLLGDIHVRQYMDYKGMCIGYPGSTELCSKGEPFEKTVTLIDLTVPVNTGTLEYRTLATRPAYGYRIMNENDLADVTAKLRDIKGKALVFVSYNPQVDNVRDRLRGAVDERRVILRDETHAACVAPPPPPVTIQRVEDGKMVLREIELAVPADTPNEEVADRIEQMEVLSPVDFLPALLPGNPALQGIAVKLLGDPAPAVTLEGWIAERLDQLCTSKA